MFSVSSNPDHHQRGESIPSPARDAPENLRHAAIERGLGGHRLGAEAAVDAIMAAGRKLIERDGVLDFNMRDLLLVAGVSNRAFYRHFGTKEALVAALAAEVYEGLIRALGAAVGTSGDPHARIGNWVDAALAFAYDPALAARGRVFVAHEARLREQFPQLFRAVGRTLVSQLLAVIEDAQLSGLLGPTAGVREARLAVRLVVATIEHHTFERTRPSAAERDAIVSMIVNSIT
jgi:AcrR family transcriptional regulator